MIHLSERIAIGQLLKLNDIDTPTSVIDFLIKADIISETKLIDYARKFNKELLPDSHVDLLVHLFQTTYPKPTSLFYSNYNLIRFLEVKGLLNIEAIEKYYENFGKEFMQNSNKSDKLEGK